MKHLWSIYLKPTELLESTEVATMLQRFPLPRVMGNCYVFVTSHPNPANVTLLDAEDLARSYADALEEQTTGCIHLTKGQATQLIPTQLE